MKLYIWGTLKKIKILTTQQFFYDDRKKSKSYHHFSHSIIINWN